MPVPGALHRASRGRSWLLVVGEWQVLLSTDVTGLQTFAETFARMACLSPGRRLGVVGRRRGFFLSGAVPQKIPVNLLPKSIGSSSRNWRGLPVKLCPTATLLLTVHEPVPRRGAGQWPESSIRALNHRLCPGFPTALEHMQPQSEDFQNECRLRAAMLSIGRAPDDRYALKRCRYR